MELIPVKCYYWVMQTSGQRLKGVNFKPHAVLYLFARP